MKQAKTKNDLMMQKVAIMEAVDKVEYEGYQLMARIAIALYDQEKYDNDQQNDWITFSTLKAIMNDNGYEYSEGWNNRGIASSVKTAEEEYRAIRDQKAENSSEWLALEYIRHAIAVSFRNKDGQLAFNPDN